MTLSRLVGLLLIFGAIALGVVALRTEETRTARRIQQADLELVRLRREMWSVQLGIAGFKAPQRIGTEVREQVPQLAAPYIPPVGTGRDIRWAKAR